jgi:UDP-glucose 4-epimerase
VLDLDRLTTAMQGHDYVIHAAASKYVDRGEQDPESVVKTNILGTMNVLQAAERARVERVVFISTDKASGYLASAYGMSKALGERLALRATVPTVTVRYGNVLRSTGSVVDKWMSLPEGTSIEITNPDMTRFWMTVSEAAGLVSYALAFGNPGTIVVPLLRSASIMDLAHACVGARNVSRIIGDRGGERVHETLVSPSEVPYARWLTDRLVEIRPAHSSHSMGPCEVSTVEEMRSDTAPRWIAGELARAVREEIP